ncbi:MAG: hypothetical protein KAR64_08900, partial [Thermoplasmatales archaeon]|nr:hypothetical protein [Thermoplasmatales archaeon]
MRSITIIVNIITIFIMVFASNISGFYVEDNYIKYQSNVPHKTFLTDIGEFGIYDLLIISPEEFVKNLHPLVEHKNAMGIKTKLVSVEK